MPCTYREFRHDAETPRLLLSRDRHAARFQDILNYLSQSAHLEGEWKVDRYSDLTVTKVAYYFTDPNTAFFMKMKFG